MAAAGSAAAVVIAVSVGVVVLTMNCDEIYIKWLSLKLKWMNDPLYHEPQFIILANFIVGNTE